MVAVEDFLLPGEDESALNATRAFALLAVICGLITGPCLCAAGLAGKCFCLRGTVFAILAFVSIVCMRKSFFFFNYCCLVFLFLSFLLNFCVDRNLRCDCVFCFRWKSTRSI